MSIVTFSDGSLQVGSPVSILLESGGPQGSTGRVPKTAGRRCEQNELKSKSELDGSPAPEDRTRNRRSMVCHFLPLGRWALRTIRFSRTAAKRGPLTPSCGKPVMTACPVSQAACQNAACETYIPQRWGAQPFSYSRDHSFMASGSF
jgi:hypothetical protein